MTFDNAAWAINGAQMGADLARRAMYAEARQSGIVQKEDLEVTELAVPGVGILISDGVGLVINDYQTDPNEIYVVSNPGSHTIPSGDMPAANPAAKSYIVAVVVGDSDFSQAGHPWMTAEDPPEGEETTFEYVRPTLIEVSAGATTLDVNYPALVLARIDIPADTTTITNSMITDLRTLASPRQSQEMFVSPVDSWTNGAPDYIPSGSAYAAWGSYSPTVKVPSWATRAIVVCSINGAVVIDSSVNVAGSIRTKLGSVVGPVASFDFPTGRVGAQRDNLSTAGEYAVSSIAGTTVALAVEGFENIPASPTTNQRLRLQNGSQMVFDVRFFEE